MRARQAAADRYPNERHPVPPRSYPCDDYSGRLALQLLARGLRRHACSASLCAQRPRPMPSVKVAGVKTYRSKGRVYHYHRATGVRIDVDLAAAPERFLARVRELDELSARGAPISPPRAQAPEEVTAKREGTLGDLFDAWRQSVEWKALKPTARV